MAFRALSFLVYFLFSTFPAVFSGSGVYKVGDSAGWTTVGNVDYRLWAATKTFQVGDIIRFEYNPQFHNVMQVSHRHYRSCNTSHPIATHTSGNDSISVSSFGHHFFLCGVPGHCQSGQKVDINVLRNSSLSSSPSLAPPPFAHSDAPSTSSGSIPMLVDEILLKISLLSLVLFSYA